MADCCASDADPRIARHFDRHIGSAVASGSLPELHATSRHLLDGLGDAGQLAPSVLELGCSSGALTVSLLERGASAARGIDLSARSIEVARNRAAAAEFTERETFEVGDGASARLQPHDWVVLDRVICCYRHADRLLANSIAAARQRYAFSVPISSGIRGVINKAVVTFENATNRFRGAPCPGYVHDVRWIEQRLAEAGFRRRSFQTTGLWYVAIFEVQPGGARANPRADALGGSVSGPGVV